MINQNSISWTKSFSATSLQFKFMSPAVDMSHKMLPSQLTTTFLTIIAILVQISAAIYTTEVYRNPIIDGPSPDPYIYRHTDGFYYWAKSTGGAVEVLKSRSLTNWRLAESREVYKAEWPLGNVWAPEIHYIRGNFYIYSSMDIYNMVENHRMYVIRAIDNKNPLGNYSEPVALRPPAEDFWAVDGTVMEHDNGELYFIYSSKASLTGSRSENLYIAQMSNPMKISSRRVLLREPKSSWEKIGAPINQGPQVLKYNGRSFLIFSASGSWTGSSCLGMIWLNTSDDPMVTSNWEQYLDDCILWGNDKESVYGVGQSSFPLSPDGQEHWIIYHAMERADAGMSGRIARAERFYWDSYGFPVFSRPSGLWNYFKCPSGQ